MKDPEVMLNKLFKAAERDEGCVFFWLLFCPSVYVLDPSLVSEFFGGRFTLRDTRRDLADRVPVLGMLTKGAIFMVNADRWKKQHSVVVHAFSKFKVGTYHTHVMNCVDKVCGYIETNMGDANSVVANVMDLMTSFASEVILKVGFGADMDSASILHYGKLFLSLFSRSITPRAILKPLLNLPLEFNRQLLSDVAEMRAFGMKMVDKCKEDFEKTQALQGTSGKGHSKHSLSLVSSLLHASSGDGNKLTSEECVDNVFGFMLAGIDTTMTALSHACVVLADRQDVQDKVRLEIRTELKRIRDRRRENKSTAGNSNDTERDTKCHDINADGNDLDVSYSELMGGFPILGAVIKEVLRLYPSVYNTIVRVARKDMEFGKLRIQKGTRVQVPLWAIARSDKIWGPDAKMFKPERFLSPSPEVENENQSATGESGRESVGPKISIPDDMKGKFATFGAGGVRQCIGRHLAVLELKAMLMVLIHKFEITNPAAQDTEKDRHNNKMKTEDTVSSSSCKDALESDRDDKESRLPHWKLHYGLMKPKAELSTLNSPNVVPETSCACMSAADADVWP
eukprot:CAMPEP_0184488428 /NCGR_PEP_ID=MMETSP0113_2-20130426/11836_1 /TAXON_ID=91329 /ORGANISM="Norrisiella sphaerica, Strain BC52" /LENGTH=567 /DNA_ID=CAMNT_0026871193 /DNA_START=385 /DNA_END=2086 /DNA_ORIENTATION=+